MRRAKQEKRVASSVSFADFPDPADEKAVTFSKHDEDDGTYKYAQQQRAGLHDLQCPVHCPECPMYRPRYGPYNPHEEALTLWPQPPSHRHSNQHPLLGLHPPCRGYTKGAPHDHIHKHTHSHDNWNNYCEHDHEYEHEHYHDSNHKFHHKNHDHHCRNEWGFRR